MDDDWKRRLDERLSRKKAEEPERLKKEYEKQLQSHRARFRCYICGTPSSGPTTWIADSEGPAGTNWDIPTGLVRCRVCGKWICNNHHYNPDPRFSVGYCKNCAEKLL